MCVCLWRFAAEDNERGERTEQGEGEGSKSIIIIIKGNHEYLRVGAKEGGRKATDGQLRREQIKNRDEKKEEHKTTLVHDQHVSEIPDPRWPWAFYDLFFFFLWSGYHAGTGKHFSLE